MDIVLLIKTSTGLHRFYLRITRLILNFWVYFWKNSVIIRLCIQMKTIQHLDELTFQARYLRWTEMGYVSVFPIKVRYRSFFYKKLAIRNRGLKWQKNKLQGWISGNLRNFSYRQQQKMWFFAVWYKNRQIWRKVKKLLKNFETSNGSVFKIILGLKVEV